MEVAAIDAFTDNVKQHIFASLNIDPADLKDLGGFESFVFLHLPSDEIVRVTHESHRSVDQILAEMNFLKFLASHGAAVSTPVYVKAPELVIQIGEFIVSRFTCARGRRVESSDWHPDLFQQWGANIGQFHMLSQKYDAPGPRRTSWQADSNFALAELPASESVVSEIAGEALKRLAQLPTDSAYFGLIHGDAHSGNFFIDGDKLTFFDFDDCGYQWFGYDVATILFGAVMQSWMDESPAAQVEAAEAFLPAFLEGYKQFMPTSTLLLEQMPLFLKIRELSLYRVIHLHLDVNNLTDWYPARFMAGRRERIEAKLPYLDLDFSKYQ